MSLQCAEFEELLCDAVDGVLSREKQAAFDAHRASCTACAEMAADIFGVTAFIGRAADIEPPKELLTRILLETSAIRSQQTTGRTRGLIAAVKRFFRPTLQPKLVMGMAMTILSISMLAQVFGWQNEVRQLKASDLEPAKIWAGVEDGAHRQWSRLVQYYENLRVVYEIQSRLKEWADQEEQERQSQPRDPGRAPQKKAQPPQGQQSQGRD
jgi:hypothetical protein